MNSFKGRYVFITGASMGIGYELAKLSAEDGANLVLIARSEDKLLEIKKEIENEYDVNTVVMVKDLIIDNAPMEIYNEIKERNIDIDVLVNNAGFGYYGEFSETDLNRQLDMIRLNVMSLVQLTGLFLPDMIKKGYGKILNIGSIAGFQGIPTHSVYSATKGFVMLFSESIADELEGTGVTVTCLCPGPTVTNFFETATMKRSRLQKFRLMKANKVAKIGFDALKENKTIIISGTGNKIVIFLERFLPRKFVANLAGRINKVQ